LGYLAELGKLLLGSGEADLQPFDLACPSLLFGFGDPVEQVGANLDDAVSLGDTRGSSILLTWVRL
jgi:hypothetical protein